MSANANENAYANNLVIDFERQFRQLLLESKSNDLIIKTIQENLNNSLKRNNLLEHELETERFNKSLIKTELDTLTTINNNSNRRNIDNPEYDLNILIHDREYLTRKIFQIQNENKELKQELTKSKNRVSSLMENQLKFSQKVNQITSMLNSLQVEIKKLETESHMLVNILCTSKNLAKKMVCVFKNTNHLNKAQFDHNQQLVKEISTIKSDVHMFINQNDNQQIMNFDEEKTSNQTHLEIYKKLVETLEIENKKLHKSLNQMLDNQMHTNNINN